MAIAKAPVMGGTSNPVSASHSAGGVARNVAVLAARAGLSTELVSLIGHDAEGEILLRDLAADHVQTRLIAPHRHLPTANYAALLNPDGSLHVAWADMAVLEAMDPAFFEPLLIALSATPFWFLDTNLTADSLAYLAQFRPKGTQLVSMPFRWRKPSGCAPASRGSIFCSATATKPGCSPALRRGPARFRLPSPCANTAAARWSSPMGRA
ncbi:PfkB family carbohydrate kinase, partial [Elstera litoralis]|uniref:PfkB family carbohydrate kinase n=1 Tax=Elstera litoralis TaxID=552518 RepID=UPI0018DBAE53